MGAATESGTKRWALALVLLFLMTTPTVSAVGYFVLAEDLPSWMQQALYAAAKLVMFLPAVWLLGIDRISLRIPLPTRTEVFAGLSFGIVVGMGSILLYALFFKPMGLFGEAATAVRDKIAGFGIDTPLRFLFFATIISVAHSFLEEYYWRGFVFGKLRNFLSAEISSLISSLAFTGHHVIILGSYFGWGSVYQLLFSIAVAIGGIIWCFMFHRWQTLYAPWISHACIDAAIFAVGYDLCRHMF
ncbi:CPBP family intramembrane glutamic endopeptidase [Thermogutta sp.]|uniref:CPBP family intramembrane glutamic endopeptidase n=1 Tax=Thermogutta sp. TaxID=1962930 RepID=UPI003C7CB44F